MAGRFTRWQLYRLLAGGFPGMTQRNALPTASVLLRDTTAHRTGARRDVPGSRLLLTDRAAMLRSGSPPGLGHATPGSLRERFSYSCNSFFIPALTSKAHIN